MLRSWHCRHFQCRAAADTVAQWAHELAFGLAKVPTLIDVAAVGVNRGGKAHLPRGMYNTTERRRGGEMFALASCRLTNRSGTTRRV
jgi:hypothetical protein